MTAVPEQVPEIAGGEAFLELLARDAGPDEFERPVLDARSAGASDETVAALDRARTLALSVSSALRTHRRREAELSALFETASDLAALTEVDDVLLAIVQRARRLLGSDVAYLTLNDDKRGDTYMRVTDGSSSAQFQQLRLPMGAGLGGLVAQTATPYSTADYLADDRFQHTAHINDGVRDEGLVSILGVPLRLGSKVIGVLFAADRHQRPFAHAEVALLSSLAAHAAVALDNARLLAESRDTLYELEQANDRMQRHTEAMQQAADAHHRLTDLVLRGGGVDDVVRDLSDVLCGAVFVVDAELRPLATSDTSEAAPVAEVLSADAERAKTSGRTVLGAGWLLAPVVAGTEQLGYLGLLRNNDLGDTERRILERGALVTALLLLFRRTVAEAESRGQRDLVDDLLTSGAHDRDHLAERARLFGMDLTRKQVVIAAEVAGQRPSTSQAAAFLAGTLGGLVGRINGRLVFIVPSDQPGASASAVHSYLSRTLGCTVTAGAAEAGVDLARLPQAHAEATRTLDALLALGREGDSASVTELGMLTLLLGGDRDLPAFVRATLGPVLDYDARRGTDLLATLDAYFANSGGVVRTAKALTVHPNTVAQRLSRITHLLGEGWQEPAQALDVQLALRLRRLGTS